MCTEMQQLSHGKHNEKLRGDLFTIATTLS